MTLCSGETSPSTKQLIYQSLPVFRPAFIAKNTHYFEMQSLRNAISGGKTNNVQHVETTNGAQKEHAGAVLPAALGGAVDAETAKYLDPSIVIDDETNQRIKKMVSETPYLDVPI